MAKKYSKSDTVVIQSSDTILFGVFSALRQAWELLGAATVLQHAGKFSSAYGLAVFSREEIGKSKLLEKHWEASVAGRLLSTHDLNSGDLMNHAKKLRAVGKILSQGVMSQGMPPDPGSSEETELVCQLRRINLRARELDPERTHLARQRAFFVEIHKGGVAWHTPWAAFDSTRSSQEILEAESAYLVRRRALKALKEKVGCTHTRLGNELHLPPELTSD
jgi:AbiV family abortive infection protein